MGVAEVKEVLALIDAAAPDAQHGQVGLEGAAEEKVLILRLDFRIYSPQRHPVRAEEEQLSAVDAQGEAAPTLGRES